MSTEDNSLSNKGMLTYVFVNIDVKSDKAGFIQ